MKEYLVSNSLSNEVNQFHMNGLCAYEILSTISIYYLLYYYSGLTNLGNHDYDFGQEALVRKDFDRFVEIQIDLGRKEMQERIMQEWESGEKGKGKGIEAT